MDQHWAESAVGWYLRLAAHVARQCQLEDPLLPTRHLRNNPLAGACTCQASHERSDPAGEILALPVVLNQLSSFELNKPFTSFISHSGKALSQRSPEPSTLVLILALNRDAGEMLPFLPWPLPGAFRLFGAC
jgi:hypothetical protein